MKDLLIRFIDSFYFLFKRIMPLQTYRYAVCGGGNLVFDLCLYAFFYRVIFNESNVELSNIITISPHIAAFIFVFPITLISGFLLNKYITFQESTLKGSTQFIRYVLVTFGTILINYIGIKLFVEQLTIPAEISKIMATLICIAFSYFSQKNFTFKEES